MFFLISHVYFVKWTKKKVLHIFIEALYKSQISFNERVTLMVKTISEYEVVKTKYV